MKILIVAKTHMANTACLGGFELDTKKSVRLLLNEGENHPKDTELEVGQVWDIQYTLRTHITPPHNEDILIESKQFIGVQPELNSFLKKNANIWKGPPEALFQKKLLFETGHSGYATMKTGVPDQSVGFWLPDTDLEFTVSDDRRHFYYFGTGQGPRIYAFPYVGFKPAIENIPVGTLVRVSLARWWSPNPNSGEKRCYCQLSGWYPD